MIELNPDAYGKFARASALADYVEALALVDKGLTMVELGELLNDAGLSVSPRENFTSGRIDKDEGLEFEGVGDRVHSLLRDRSRVLGDAYPFDEKGGRLVPRGRPLQGPYVALLATTLTNAFRIATTPPAHEVFEETVSAVMRRRGWKTVNFSALRRENRSFDEALEVVGKRLGLQVVVRGGPRSRSARDAGVDSISHLPWCGSRRGCWIALGQATCAESDDWKRKINEPSQPLWKDLLGEPIEPVVFLAVPHHSEPSYRHQVMYETKRVLLDRLSLVPHKAEVSPDEKGLIDAAIKAVERV